MAAADRLSQQFGEYTDILTDAAIAQFLGTENWTCQQDLGFEQVWSHPDVTSGFPSLIHLPRNSALDDYSRRLAQAVSSISSVYDWTLAAVAEHVASVRADLFFLRLDQTSRDGTIPLRQASVLLDGIDTMIRSSALVAHNPSSSAVGGRIPNYVQEFLNEDVRMGHTKRGSFIITVAARLNVPEHSASDSSDPRSAEQQQGKNADAAAPGTENYTRRVMTTLARSLEVTRDLARDEKQAGAFEDALAGGMRLPLVRALRSVGSTEGVAGLGLNFEWSALEPVDNTVASELHIDRESIIALESIEDRLVKRVEPREEEIVGPVIGLKLSESDKSLDVEGDVVIRADIDHRSAKVSVSLRGNDYDWAIWAHQKRLPFSVRGILEKTGSGWKLGGHVVADLTFLQFRAASEGGGPTQAD
ncbi:hypothetical protein RDV89_00950 [Nocardioides zeae]|uniref:Uncharacterized protein n=1 Tax=Nocardioides imazamoxiresistens TaxID=3231893 RepID=A0ABU3PQW8_9ACTN|nr:hypothetical protein [Nocardioides zeae]MDT9591614.1 hypothetical protein [Nocardioides zeae]